MKKEMLKLLHPQWQGSGNLKDLYLGAMRIKNELLHEGDYIEVEVSLDDELEIENNILGYRHVCDNLKKAYKIISESAPDKIITIGGDCSVELGPVSYLNKKYKNLAVLWFDAHGDLNSPQSSETKNFHGMPLRALLGEGDEAITNGCFSILEPQQVVLAGLRELDAPEAEYIKEKNLKTLTIDQLAESSKGIVEYLKSRNVENVYIHLDLDVIDTGCISDVMCPCPEGIDIKALMNIFEQLKANFSIVGNSILEYPGRETDSIKVIQELMGFELN